MELREAIRFIKPPEETRRMQTSHSLVAGYTSFRKEQLKQWMEYVGLDTEGTLDALKLRVKKWGDDMVKQAQAQEDGVSSIRAFFGCEAGSTPSASSSSASTGLQSKAKAKSKAGRGRGLGVKMVAGKPGGKGRGRRSAGDRRRTSRVGAAVRPRCAGCRTHRAETGGAACGPGR